MANGFRPSENSPIAPQGGGGGDITISQISDRGATGADMLAAETVADAQGVLALGAAALLNVGTVADTVAAGNDSRFPEAVTPAVLFGGNGGGPFYTCSFSASCGVAWARKHVYISMLCFQGAFATMTLVVGTGTATFNAETGYAEGLCDGNGDFAVVFNMTGAGQYINGTAYKDGAAASQVAQAHSY